MSNLLKLVILLAPVLPLTAAAERVIVEFDNGKGEFEGRIAAAQRE